MERVEEKNLENKIKDIKKIYFMGIAGTGMASVAGLCQEAGYEVSGSDQAIYPPMSTMLLEELKLKVFQPFDPENLSKAKPDLVVVANVLSRTHKEVEALKATAIPFTSFPVLLGEIFLKNINSVVVSGTHGKTTTTSLCAHVLEQLGENPSFFVGGQPKNFPRSFRFKKDSSFFVVEGDEYDTAYFDKGPKFLHYHPKFLILNNLEYDHADIYPNIEAIEAQFQKLISLVKDEGAIIAFKDDERLMKLKGQRRFSLSSLRKEEFASPEVLTALKEARYDEIHSFWKVSYLTKEFGEIGFNAEMGGDHNFANISQILTLIQVLAKAAVFKKTPTKETIANAFQTFKGVKRRLDLLAKNVEIEVYEDFAHHPTAVKAVIEGFRKMKPNKRLIVCFEPKNATSRRNTFFKEYVEVLKLADQVFLGACPADQKIKEEERMDVPLLAKSVGAKAQSFEDNMMLLESLQSFIKPKDAVIFMSSGSFAGIQHRFAEFINLKKI